MIYFILVNYNNTQFSFKYVDSVLGLSSLQECSIHIVDNNSNESEKKKLIEWNRPKQVNLHLLDRNVGYFPALDYGYQVIREQLTDGDFIVIGNNDLVFDTNFAERLLHANYVDDMFVICPDIINIGENHQNPAIITKYSKLQLLYLDLYHSCYFMALLINFVSRIYKFRGKQKSKPGWQNSQYISIGYGACYVLTRNFFNHIKNIPDYLFLMNEENALSDIVFKHGGRVYYDCKLIVHHMEHSSVIKLPSKRKFVIEQESYRISKKHFDNRKLYDKQLVEANK